ncbi:2-dehydropantoate 2-reductase [bacterium]|nr:2-dehydropantoate 2-reductase [bacterium]
MSKVKTIQPEVLVIGAGAVGGFYGAKLAQAGAKVSVLCRTDYMPVKARGIRIHSPQGDMIFVPQQVLKSLAEYSGQPDVVLVALKMLPDINVANIIKPVVGAQTSILLLQNGIDVEAPVAKKFPKNEIISGLAFVCLSRSGPGWIDHQCYGRVSLGKYPNGTSERIRQLQQLFEKVDIPCKIDEDIVTARWSKLIWNAPFNPISVLVGGVNTAQILALDDTRNIVEKIMEEVCAIAKAEGHPQPDDIVQQYIAATEKMTPYKTSMLQDYVSGRPLEIEAILGTPLKIAKKHKLSAPYIEMTYSLLKLAEQRVKEKKRLGAKISNFFKR